MAGREGRAAEFETQRGHLRAVAYRMLGTLGEVDDAVQEAWLRFDRADTSGVENVAGWLTTVVARVCLDALRARKARREEPLDAPAAPVLEARAAADPEEEALLADSVGVALLVVLDRLAPAERLAFVLHDMFALPFEDIAPIVGRSLDATRQLASRARRRVRGGAAPADADRTEQRRLVEAFLAASRTGDLNGLLAVLDPEVVRRADAAATPAGVPTELRGAQAVASGALAGARRAGAVRAVLALVDGRVGVMVTRQGRLATVLSFVVAGGRITAIEVMAEPARLGRLDLRLLEA